MLTAGFSWPDTAALNELMSGMLASTLLTGTLARLFQFGTACLNGSHLPCGSGISAVTVVVVGSADAVTASGTDRASAAALAAMPMVLPVRVFTFCSSCSSGRLAC